MGEAKTKLDEAQKAKDARDAAIAHEQKLAEKTKKAEAKAENAREGKEKATAKEHKEAAEKAQEKSEKSAKKAEDAAALAKNKAAEAAGKAGAKENTPKKPQLSACEQCKAKCQSGACKQWCHTHWCDSAAKQPSDAPQPE